MASIIFCTLIIFPFSTTESFPNYPFLSYITQSARSAPISRCCGVALFSR